MTDIIKELEKKREQAKLGGGKKRVNAQHARGKLTARERIDIEERIDKRDTTREKMIDDRERDE